MEIIYILERLSWSESLEDGWCSEERFIRHAFKTYEEAEKFAEADAESLGIACKWNNAERYAGTSIFDGVVEKGLCYTIHKGELH